MKSTNELRRLNLVKVDGKIYQVFSIDSCFVGLSEVGKDELIDSVDVMLVEGVNITKEILSKIGTKFGNDFNPGWNINGAFNVYYIVPQTPIGELVIEPVHFEIELPYGYRLKRAYFVHRLQNLYHDFTNQELEIKL